MGMAICLHLQAASAVPAIPSRRSQILAARQQNAAAAADRPSITAQRQDQPQVRTSHQHLLRPHHAMKLHSGHDLSEDCCMQLLWSCNQLQPSNAGVQSNSTFCTGLADSVAHLLLSALNTNSDTLIKSLELHVSGAHRPLNCLSVQRDRLYRAGYE